MKKIVFTLIYILVAAAAYAQPLAERLNHLVEHADVLKASEVGISVYNLTKGESVYAYQDQKLYRPASIEKLITSVTALSLLGEEYSFDTRLLYTGEITAEHSLEGDLYVVGGFDPEFMEEDMMRLTQALVDKGIRTIHGRVIADVSMTDSVHWGTGWAWDDTPESFQPYLSPLMLNRGCVSVTVSPTEKGEAPTVTVSPASDYYTIDNQAVSHHSDAGPMRITRDWISNGNTIRISGDASKRTSKLLNMYSSKDFFLATFCYQLNKEEIGFTGRAFGTCPQEATELVRVGHPLSQVLLRALKKSDNLDAEAMFYALGAMKNDSTGQKSGIGFMDAQRVINHFMHRHIGHSPKHYKIVDGSGVSMYDYISPDLLMSYLKYAYKHEKLFPVIFNSLPVAGVDGTLQNRMKGGKAFRRVWAKTGTVTGVSSLAGYAKNSDGDMLAFVIINQNVLNGREARTFQDKFCEMLAR